MKGATFLRRGLGDLTQVSTRAPVKGATTRSGNTSTFIAVSTRAPVKGATPAIDFQRALSNIVSTRAPVKGATAIIKTAVFSRRYIN